MNGTFPKLEAVPFDATRLEAVEFFECGDDPWSLAAAQWISAPLEFNGALKSIRDHGTKVRLFYLGPMVVGFGTLGATTAPWPAPDDSHKEIIGYIPQFAVHSDMQGQPEGAGDDKFSRQILGHLLYAAKEASYRFVGLMVDEKNVKAIGFYQSAGFNPVAGTVTKYGRRLIRMLVAI